MHHPPPVPTAAVKSHSELTRAWHSSPTVQPKAGLLPLCSVFWGSLFKKTGPASSGDCSWRQEESTDSSSSFCPCRATETPALALLFIELFQNTRFIPVQQCNIKHWCCRGCRLLLYLCWPFFHLFQRGPLNCHIQKPQGWFLTAWAATPADIQCSQRWGYISQSLLQLPGLGKRSTSLSSARTCTEWLLSGHKSLFCVRRKNWVDVSKLLEVLLSK